MATRRQILIGGTLMTADMIVGLPALTAPYPGTTIDQVVNSFNPLENVSTSEHSSWHSYARSVKGQKEWRDFNRVFLETQPDLFDFRSRPTGQILTVDHSVQLFIYAYDGTPPGGLEKYYREIYTYLGQEIAKTVRAQLGGGPFVPLRPIEFIGIKINEWNFEPDHLLRTVVQRG